MEIHAALADVSSAAASLQSRIAHAYWCGRPYLLDPAAIELIENQNFEVTLNWPEGVQALPSGNPGRLVVVLDGFLYRRPQ
jgi:hypothetical protein